LNGAIGIWHDHGRARPLPEPPVDDLTDAAALAGEVSSALDEYASMFREAVRIAADGTSEDELRDWTSACWESAVDLRLIEGDRDSLAAHAPAEVGVLVRELYESFVVFSGVKRVAHLLSLPLASCANGETLAPLIRERSTFAEWYTQVSSTPFSPRDLPRSLVRANWRDRSPLAIYGGPRRQLAANADRRAESAAQEPRAPRALDDVFAERVARAIALYGEAVVRVRSAAPDEAALDELFDWLTESARQTSPVLIGFARLVDRGQGRLHPPDGAASLARLVADGLVTLACAVTADDLDTLPYPDPLAIAERAIPVADWLAVKAAE
jgi:hypothetical protein